MKIEMSTRKTQLYDLIFSDYVCAFIAVKYVWIIKFFTNEESEAVICDRILMNKKKTFF